MNWISLHQITAECWWWSHVVRKVGYAAVNLLTLCGTRNFISTFQWKILTTLKLSVCSRNKKASSLSQGNWYLWCITSELPWLEMMVCSFATSCHCLFWHHVSQIWKFDCIYSVCHHLQGLYMFRLACCVKFIRLRINSSGSSNAYMHQ